MESMRVLRWAAWGCVVCALTFCVGSQPIIAGGRPQENDPGAHLLSSAQGREIAAVALAEDEPIRGAHDCSHLVQQIYSAAGYEYPYASSFDLYAGNGNFRRVRHAQAGDLITWPGHVGIVISAAHHTFYSLVRSGLQTEDYLGPYWRSRGRPRFYRFAMSPRSDVESAKLSAPLRPSGNNSNQRSKRADAVMRAEAEKETAKEIPEETSMRGKVAKAPRESESDAAVEAAPLNILITSEQRRPTIAEASDGFAELSRAAASSLRTAEPLRVNTTIIILDEFLVERVETKRNTGRVHLQIDSHVRIGVDGLDFKRRREKVRWDLQRGPSGWQAVAPADRVFVDKDDAVRVLAAQLAELAGSEAAANHDETVLSQEARIANLLSAVLQK